ncbi:MAG: hypothetical protein ACI9CV_001519, partial [Ilumatobacter sp.]
MALQPLKTAQPITELNPTFHLVNSTRPNTDLLRDWTIASVGTLGERHLITDVEAEFFCRRALIHSDSKHAARVMNEADSAASELGKRGGAYAVAGGATGGICGSTEAHIEPIAKRRRNVVRPHVELGVAETVDPEDLGDDLCLV